MAEIKIGDIVRLKSGGPPMTVIAHLSASPDVGGSVLCLWLRDGGRIGARGLLKGTLERRDEDNG